MHEMNFIADRHHAGSIMRPVMGEYSDTPAFILDFELLGPSNDDREEYFYLLGEVEKIKAEGHIIVADALLCEAHKLVNSKWRECVHNTVTIGGKNDVINQYFKGSSYTASWFLGLLGAGTISTGDVMSSHSGWSELTPYSGARPAIVWGTSSSGSNTATQISFTINASATIAGAFIVNNSTAGGTTGTLYSAADFTSARTVASGDTLNVTPTITFS